MEQLRRKGTRVVVAYVSFKYDRVSATVAMTGMSASLPPGLTRDPQLEYIETSNGGEHDWMTFSSTRLYTNSFIISPGPPQKVIIA